MTILNLMLGRKRGGLEQAAVDYAEAMALATIGSLTITSPDAWIETALVNAKLPYRTLRNAGYWDILAMRRLRAIAKEHKATAIVCHGNRALGLALRACKGRIPVIAVAHNYSTRRFAQADQCFAITQHLIDHLKLTTNAPITCVPNMVRVSATAPRPPFRSPPVIGAMGRLVAKKGFHTYIEALAIMKSSGVAFHALLGGDGEDVEILRELITQSGLTKEVELIGWVRDKAAFFERIDLFVVPSHHEPFGIVLIEAMAHAVPVVTTDAEGPREIVHHMQDGLITLRANAEALASTMMQSLQNPLRSQHFGQAGQALVTQNYSIEKMASRLQEALAPYMVTHD